MPGLSDIRIRSIESIDAAIVLAVFAALYSSATYSQHGSLANRAFVSAVHWLIVLLLAAAKFEPTAVLQCDVEVTWLMYGMLFGQAELDAAPAFLTIVLSAFGFLMHKRKQRQAHDQHDTDGLTTAPTSPTTVQEFA